MYDDTPNDVNLQTVLNFTNFKHNLENDTYFHLYDWPTLQLNSETWLCFVFKPIKHSNIQYKMSDKFNKYYILMQCKFTSNDQYTTTNWTFEMVNSITESDKNDHYPAKGEGNGHFHHIEVIDLPFHTIPFVSCFISLIEVSKKWTFIENLQQIWDKSSCFKVYWAVYF